MQPLHHYWNNFFYINRRSVRYQWLKREWYPSIWLQQGKNISRKDKVNILLCCPNIAKRKKWSIYSSLSWNSEKPITKQTHIHTHIWDSAEKLLTWPKKDFKIFLMFGHLGSGSSGELVGIIVCVCVINSRLIMTLELPAPNVLLGVLIWARA